MTDETAPLVLSGRSSNAMETWLGVHRRAEAIDRCGADSDREILATARDLTSRLLVMADVIERLSTRPPTPRDTHAMRRRRWTVATRRPDEVAMIHDVIESDGTGSVRRIELRDAQRPAALSIRCRPVDAMLPFDADESHIGPALREAAALMRTSIASLVDPDRPDPLVAPRNLEDAAAAMIMRMGDLDPCDDPDDARRITTLHAGSPWRDAFLHDTWNRRSMPAPEDAHLLPTAYAASVRFEDARQKGDPRRAAHMLIEPWRLTLPCDVEDPIARLRLLGALEALRGGTPRGRGPTLARDPFD